MLGWNWKEMYEANIKVVYFNYMTNQTLVYCSFFLV